MASIEKILDISKEKLKQIYQEFEDLVSDRTNKESDLKYRTIFNASPDLIYITDFNGALLDANQAWIQKIGVNKKEFPRYKITDFLAGETTSELEEVIKKIRSGEEVRCIEVKAKNINGEIFDFEINSLPIEKDGTLLLVINIARDITKRKAIEKKIKDSEEFYRLISESANDLIRVMNDKFEFEYINENVHERILGYSNEDMIGKMSLIFHHPDDWIHVVKATRRYLKGEAQPYETRFKCKNGSYKWFEIKAKVFFDNQGVKKILSIARDIDERKLAEFKLKESEEKYRNLYAQLKLYKNLFAHDMNNILQIIRSSNELSSYYLADSEIPHEVLELSEKVSQQVERGAKLVSNVVKLTELEEITIPIISQLACSTLSKSIDFIKKVYDKDKINLTIQCDEKEIHVYANDLLQEVFDNILLNAIKYNHNPVIEIIIKVFEELIEDTSFIRIEFFDNGIGIPDEKKNLIFESGNRDLKESKGMGFGLSIVKKIIDSYDGKIWVENRIKDDYTQGSKFIVLLKRST